ncbi:hypothetical protein QP358_03455 [Nosocomiicoccus ampullae]|nr:hypothetical protein [Nosocomiicoccus ampullae]
MNSFTYFSISTLMHAERGSEVLNRLSNNDVYISNVKGENVHNIAPIPEESAQDFYKYLIENYKFGVKHEGSSVLGIKNDHNLHNVHVMYYDENYYNAYQFKIQKGDDLYFDFNPKVDPIPILIGEGLSKTYNIGDVIEIPYTFTVDPVKYIVTGFLERDSRVSNMYLPITRQYLNYSIIIPINDEMLTSATRDITMNGIHDLLIFTDSEEDIKAVQDKMKNRFGVPFNFYTPEENIDEVNQYLKIGFTIQLVIFAILFILLTVLIYWNASIASRLLKKIFAVNFIVGLSYKELRIILNTFFIVLLSLNTIALIVALKLVSYESYVMKIDSSMVFGYFGILPESWLIIGGIFISNLLISFVLTEIMVYKFKKIPFTLGVFE